MRIIFQCFIFIVLSSCSMAPISSQKINGVSYVAARDSINEGHINPVVNINANYAAIMPFGFETLPPFIIYFKSLTLTNIFVFRLLQENPFRKIEEVLIKSLEDVLSKENLEDKSKNLKSKPLLLNFRDCVYMLCSFGVNRY